MNPVFPCPKCTHPLRVSDEALGRQIKCPLCSALFMMPPSRPTPDRKGAPPEVPVSNRPSPEPPPPPPPPEELPSLSFSTATPPLPSPRPGRSRPAQRGGRFAPFTFKVVVKDPDHKLEGTLPATITPDGLELTNKKKKVFLPAGGGGRHLRGNTLAVPHEDRELKLTVQKPFYQVNRVSQDLAAFLAGDRSRLQASDYRLPWYLIAAAVLPLGIPILTLGGALPGAAGAGLFGLSLYLAQRERWSAGLRLALTLLVAFVGYSVLGVLLVFMAGWSLWGLPWAAFSPPDKSFTVKMPGKPEQQTTALLFTVGPEPATVLTVGRPHEAYIVSFTKIPAKFAGKSSAPKHLEVVRDVMVSVQNGTLTEDKEISQGDFPGREFHYTVSKPQKGTAVARIFRTQNRLFQLVVVGSAVAADSRNVQEFFGSFQINSADPGSKLPGVIQELVQRAQRGDLQAMRDLGKKGPAAKEAIPGLTEALKKENPRKMAGDNGNNRLELAVALVRIDPMNEYAKWTLKECLTDPNKHVQVMAAYELARLQPGDEKAVQRLVDLFSAGGYARLEAAECLGKLGPVAKAAFPGLLETFSQRPNMDACRVTCQALILIDPVAALPHLIKALASPDASLPTAAAEALGDMGPAAKEAIPALRELAKRPGWEGSSSKALKKIEGN